MSCCSGGFGFGGEGTVSGGSRGEYGGGIEGAGACAVVDRCGGRVRGRETHAL